MRYFVQNLFLVAENYMWIFSGTIGPSQTDGVGLFLKKLYRGDLKKIWGVPESALIRGSVYLRIYP